MSDEPRPAEGTCIHVKGCTCIAQARSEGATEVIERLEALADDFDGVAGFHGAAVALRARLRGDA